MKLRRQLPFPKKAVAWLLTAACALAAPGRIGAQDRSGSSVRAQVSSLFSLSQFVTWPAGKFPTPTSPLIVGFYNVPALEDQFAEANTGREMDARRFVVRHVASDADIRSCHMLFVGRAEPRRIKSILNETRRSNVLSVGNADDFTASGGAVTFALVRETVRLQINVEALRRAGLKMSSGLLRLPIVDLVNADGRTVNADTKMFR